MAIEIVDLPNKKMAVTKGFSNPCSPLETAKSRPLSTTAKVTAGLKWPPDVFPEETVGLGGG
jgi:hypothetical protein